MYARALIKGIEVEKKQNELVEKFDRLHSGNLYARALIKGIEVEKNTIAELVKKQAELTAKLEEQRILIQKQAELTAKLEQQLLQIQKQDTTSVEVWTCRWCGGDGIIDYPNEGYEVTCFDDSYSETCHGVQRYKDCLYYSTPLWGPGSDYNDPLHTGDMICSARLW